MMDCDMVGVTETKMALTDEDLKKIDERMDGLEDRIVGRVSAKIDAARVEIVEDVTDVLNESLGMISDQITRVDKRIDKLRIVSRP